MGRIWNEIHWCCKKEHRLQLIMKLSKQPGFGYLTPGRNRVAVAEFNIGLMIAVARKLTLSCTGLSRGRTYR